jgi:chemotaxis protein MotB
LASTSGSGGGSRLRKKGGDEKLETAGMMRWLLTYADMITLLLALFIILFSISTINKVKLQRLVHDLGGGFNAEDAINNPPNGGQTGNSTGNGGDADLAKIQKQINAYIQKKQLETKVQTKIDKRGLVITLLTDKALYDSGSAELRPETRRILDQVDVALKKNTSEIRVEGNTDNVPITTSAYPTNWELSTARAVGVTRYLVEKGGLAPTRISASGYAEFRPTHKNLVEADRQFNRRVDIVILNSAKSAAEEGD